MTGKRVLITAGPTCEAIDPVRYITNRSSGKMGYALARAAHDMGAEVTVVSGPVAVEAKRGVSVVNVVSAQQMYDEVMRRCDGADIIIACAAVADYTPDIVPAHKMKKKDSLTIELHKTKDILKALGERKNFHLVGFAAETQGIIGYAKEKLERKNLDMIVANDVSKEGSGFESDFNAVTMIKRSGEIVETLCEQKQSIARRIMLEIERDIAEK